MIRRYLIASDFDQTLSFNDSGLVLSELIGVSRFQEKVAGLSDSHLVQQGAELAYLLRHDPEFRRVRREHLVETGRRVRLKKDIGRFIELVNRGLGGCEFCFSVISAAPKLVVDSALDGLVPVDHIYATEFEFDEASGEICTISRVPAGYGKVAILGELEATLEIGRDHVVYIGDGSSDIHVMLQVNSGGGFTIAVSEARHVTRIAKRTVLGDSALSVIVPILEDIVGWDEPRIRQLFGLQGLVLQEWERARTDWVSIRDHAKEGG
jgi:2-hydroxy-3-keto-5-methylthiopentenyl-1-phosphate phosphatase